MSVERIAQLRQGLETVKTRIERACADAGRATSDVNLVVVTKTFPASDIRILVELGVSDVAENKQQEFAAKKLELGSDVSVRWHFVGHMQSNKAGAIAAHADVVHSLDRPKLVAAMDRVGVGLDVLVQVSLDKPGADHRSGVAPEGVAPLAEMIAATQHLRLRGIMAVAPLAADPAESFAQLVQIHQNLRSDHPSATWLSAGMSADLEQAIHAGATHVRVGSAVLGSRPSVK